MIIEIITYVTNYVASNSMEIEGIKENMFNQSGSVIYYSSWHNKMRLEEIGSYSANL